MCGIFAATCVLCPTQRQQESESDMAKRPSKSLPRKKAEASTDGVAAMVNDIAALVQRAMETAMTADDFDRLKNSLAEQANKAEIAGVLMMADLHGEYEEEPIDFVDVPAVRFREFRVLSGWTQSGIAMHMSNLGYGWNRTTVVEIERLRRAIGLEELLALAALFSIPVVHFLVPPDESYVWLPREWKGVGVAAPGDETTAPPGRTISDSEAIELLLGPGATLGKGGLDWELPKKVAFVTGVDERPAIDFWAERLGGE